MLMEAAQNCFLVFTDRVLNTKEIQNEVKKNKTNNQFGINSFATRINVFRTFSFPNTQTALVHIHGDGYRFGDLSQGIFFGLIYGYRYTVQKVHTVHKRAEIPVPKDKFLSLNDHFWDRTSSPRGGPVPVSVYVNKPLQSTIA